MRGRLRKVRWNVLLGVSSHDNYSASLRSSAASSSDIAIVYLLSTCNAILKDLNPLFPLLCFPCDPFVSQILFVGKPQTLTPLNCNSLLGGGRTRIRRVGLLCNDWGEHYQRASEKQQRHAD